MARRMSEINKKNSRYLGLIDLEEMTGRGWESGARMQVTIVEAFEDFYPARDNKPAEPGFFLRFAGIEKPMGCKWENRTALEMMLGDVEWSTESLAGIRLELYGVPTPMGPGLRCGPVANSVQEASSAAREQINTSIQNQGLGPSGPQQGLAHQGIPPDTRAVPDPRGGYVPAPSSGDAYNPAVPAGFVPPSPSTDHIRPMGVPNNSPPVSSGSPPGAGAQFGIPWPSESEQTSRPVEGDPVHDQEPPPQPPAGPANMDQSEPENFYAEGDPGPDREAS